MFDLYKITPGREKFWDSFDTVEEACEAAMEEKYLDASSDTIAWEVRASDGTVLKEY